ncbi:hypothetical protein BH10PSE16_BH10PSE16_00750 [soil metagenome]
MNARMIFDRAEAIGMAPLEKLKLVRELKMIRTDIAGAGAGPLAAMKKMKLAVRLKQIRAQLGAGNISKLNQPLAQAQTLRPAINNVASENENQNNHPTPETIEAAPQGQAAPDAGPDPVKKSASLRQKDNDGAIEALRRVKAGEADPADPAIRESLKGYSGSGGGLKTAQGTSGSPHEYYTPEPVAKAMWEMLDGLGFKGGKVLDPSAGMGVFARTKPASVAVEQIELDSVSGEINGLLNDGPTVATRVASFEEVAASTDDETFDAVVTNVPFGDKAMRGAHWRKDKKYQNANLQEYFILRGLEKIKPGGFAAFIVPPSVVASKGGKGVKLRNAVSMMAEFVGAYRLPNMVFDEAGADTITDIIILRKHGKANKLKIDELAQQSAAMLTEAGVIWPDFVDGNYFNLEGKRFQIGETTTGKGRFGEVEKVAFTGTIGSIAALLKPFPKASRINWALLDTVETAPIVYAEGDTVFSGGAMLQMVEGKLVPVDGGLQNEDDEAITMMARFTSPLDAINQGLSFDNASRALENEETSGRLGGVPRWIVAAHRAAKAATSAQGEWFEAILAGMAVQEFAQAGEKEPRNYTEAYPELSKVLARVQGYAAKRAGVGGELVADALQNIAVARKKGAFTAWWNGSVAADKVVLLTAAESYAKIKIDSEDDTGFVPIAEMSKAFADFDPLNDDQWCVSPDGSGIMSADDYYFGNYAQFLARAERELTEATDPAIKEKLLRQHGKAMDRITLVDPSRMRFSLETAFVSQDDKAEFVKQYVSEDIVLETDGKGEKSFRYTGKAPGSYASADEVRRIKTLRRYAIYLNNKTVTTGSGDRGLDDPQEEKAFLDSIKSLVNSSSAQFDSWCKANDGIASAIRTKLNAPENLRFVEVPNFAPVDIPNWNPAWVPHGYQYAAVRRFSKRFSGILGFDVGLGKTLTSLAAVQYCQSIGAKKKTIFVVPSATLTNWKKEVGKAYKDISDCLFVGLATDKFGNTKYRSSAVDSDLNVVRENRHSKIFMTFETLSRIPLRKDTLEGYKSYLLANDDSFSKAAEEGANTKTRDVISSESAVAAALESGSKSAAVPYFEDMGVDSLVIDEAHGFKNSKKTSSEFKATKFVANPASSQRGMDMQAKCWYIRGITGGGDGVMALTATPVTNSPSEIYSMLSLAIGEQELNAMTGATGCDSFMMNTCDVENRDEDDLTGAPKNQRTLKGIANLDILRRVLDSAAMIETPATVAAKGIIIEVPEAEEAMSKIELSAEDAQILKGIKEDYLEAAATKRAKLPMSQAEAIMASPFNAIRKMTKLITDKELHEGVFRFGFDSKGKTKADAVVAAFNKLKITEERKEYELDPGTDTTGMKSKLVSDKETGAEVMIFYVPVQARIEGSEFALPSVDYGTHDRFMTLIDKAGIGLSAKASPKTQALLANLQNENAHPRWKPAKQIVFCDELALHHKLRLLISAETSIAVGKICIVNAKSVSPDEIQDVQDGFNANEDDNRYQIIIANKKAEVGINLQQGTQAIHHLTIGWTPDSIHQRNGRGVRQGNKVETPVMVYHYEANGTFDAYKRRLVSVKGDWIGSLMDKDAEHVSIEGDLSAEDYARMAALVGDSSGMAQFNEDMAKKAKQQVTESAKITQVSAISVAQGQKQWLEKYEDDQIGFTAWVRAKRLSANTITSNIETLRIRSDKTESVDVARRCHLKIEELSVKRDAIEAAIAGVTVQSYGFIKASTSPQDAAAVVNWSKEVALNRKMLDEARAAFDIRATQGYGKDAAMRLDTGTATILNGKIISDGDLVVANGKPGLVKVFTPRYGQPPVAQFLNIENSNAWTALAGMTIESHGTPGSEARSDILKMLVELDEATIAVKGEELYARVSSDVRGALRSAIPSLWIDASERFGRDCDWIAAPNFPLVMPKIMVDGEFCKGIIAAQAAMLEFNVNGWRRTFRFIDSRNQGTEAGRTIWGAVAAWMTANNQVMTVDEVIQLDGGDFEAEIRSALVAALDGLVAKSSNIAEFDAAMIAWAQAAYPWITGFDASMEVKFNMARHTKDAKAKLDDGSMKYDVVVSFSALQNTRALAGMERAIVAKFATGAMNDELVQFHQSANRDIGEAYLATLDQGKHLLIDFMQVVADAVGGRIDGDKIRMDESPFADDIRAAAKLGKGAVPSMNADYLANTQGITQAVLAYAAKQKQAGMGLDIDGLMTLIARQPGVSSIKVATNGTAKMRDKYTGSFMYNAGEYLRVVIPRGSLLQEKFSDRVRGLEGRYWDKPNGEWLVSLTPAKFSDGKAVADIASLAKYLDIDISKFKK